jgi:hypothetical protein
LWLSIKSQFLGNRTTRALYADQEFHSFSQGDLPITEYCRRYKKLVEDLRDLGKPVSDITLVLNIIRGLNERFLVLGLHLRRTYPLPSFLQVRDDLALEEVTMANAPPAAALVALTAPGSMGSTTPTPSTGTPRHSQLPAPSQPSGGVSDSRYNSNQRGKGGKRSGGRHSTISRADAGPSAGQGSHYSNYNPWSGTIYMWSGQRPPTAPRPPQGAPSSPQALLAEPPGQWTRQWGVPPASYGPPPGYVGPPAPTPIWDQQTLAANFQIVALQQPVQHEWHFDTGATSHMTSDAGIISQTHPSRHIPSHTVVDNGHLISVTSTGTTHLPHNISLNNVVVSPSLIKDLIFVCQFTIDNNCSVEFDSLGCSVKDLPTRREILRCDSSRPLYPLRLPATTLHASTSTTSLWHRRLGDPGHVVLSHLAQSSVISCNKSATAPLCHACQLGHHVRLPFHTSTSRATKIFQLIHCDLWTSPLTSVSS